MKESPENQITQWLKKLERESWQLELLVSAFTIFLLIQASGAFSDFHDSLGYQYNLGDNILVFIYMFLALVGLSIKALAVFLVLHLMLRGFWIGAIGLRSVQSNIDFSKLNYSQHFTERLKKKVVSLDNLVVLLDQICSVIFSFSFLVISVLISFGLYFVFMGCTGVLLASAVNGTEGTLKDILAIFSAVIFLGILFTGLIYLIDFFTLGFFKKYKWLSRIYYPIYRFYGFITISGITRSIYYYLISKFSKKRIRLLYLVLGVIILSDWLIDFDQYQYFPESENKFALSYNYYDDKRPAKDHIVKASIQSQVIEGSFLQLFLRYEPADNEDIRQKCPDYEPLKNDGINSTMQLKISDEGINLSGRSYTEEDHRQQLDCLSSIFEVIINDSIRQDVNFYFFEHPDHEQQGLLAMIPTEDFVKGENVLEIGKFSYDKSDSTFNKEDFAYIPFWFSGD